VLLVVSPAATSAFSPGRTGNYFARLNGVKMMGKPASSKEEDLDLTRSIIMQHIASADNDILADDDDDGQSQKVVASDGKGNRQPMKKIKSFGSKMKKKIKNKIQKE